MLDTCFAKSDVNSDCLSISENTSSILSFISVICDAIFSISTSESSTFLLPSSSFEVVSFIDSARTPISFFNSLTYLTISSADSDVLLESCLTWSATTANPFPASPALAASIDALSAKRLLWLATFLTISTISLILSILS